MSNEFRDWQSDTINDLRAEVERLKKDRIERQKYADAAVAENKRLKQVNERQTKNIMFNTNMKAKLERLREVLREAKPVYATPRNTASVRKGYEMGGYVKHYIIESQDMRAALEDE